VYRLRFSIKLKARSFYVVRIPAQKLLDERGIAKSGNEEFHAQVFGKRRPP